MLWIAQWILALVFIFAGVSKLVMPVEQMVGDSGLSAGLLRFVGIMETLGGLGMILPGLLHIQTRLTPLAALGLIIIMIGATSVTVRMGQLPLALIPALTGLIAVFVAYGRLRLIPLR